MPKVTLTQELAVAKWFQHVTHTEAANAALADAQQLRMVLHQDRKSDSSQQEVQDRRRNGQYAKETKIEDKIKFRMKMKNAERI